MMYENGKDNQCKQIVCKVYVIIEGKKVYIEPELLKNCVFNPHEAHIFTGRRIHIERNEKY